MELTHLKYFVTVAHELHFRRAAARLHVSQAPLSQQIMKLENELGVKLFERTSRSVKLTEPGRIFLTEAEIIVKRAEHAVELMSRYVSMRGGHLVIGYNESALNSFLPDAIFRFTNAYPDIEIEMVEMESEVQLNALRSGEIDVGFLRPYQYDLSDVESQFVFSEYYVLAMPRTQSGSRKKMNLKNLNDMPLLLFARNINPPLFDRIVEIIHAQGVFPKIKQYARNKTSMLALVKAGFGCAIVPESSVESIRRDLVISPLPHIFPPVEIYAVSQKDVENPIIQKFIDFTHRREQ